MRITLMQTGKTKDPFIREGVEEFRKRMIRYAPFSIETMPDLKNSRNMTMKEVQENEGNSILKRIKPGIIVILLDERGKMYDSIAFAKHLNSLEGRVNHLLFVIGGPYGFSEEVYKRANEKLSLSPADLLPPVGEGPFYGAALQGIYHFERGTLPPRLTCNHGTGDQP